MLKTDQKLAYKQENGSGRTQMGKYVHFGVDMEFISKI